MKKWLFYLLLFFWSTENIASPLNPYKIYIRDSLYRSLKEILPKSLKSENSLKSCRSLEWIPVAGSTLYTRLYFEGNKTSADIVVGLEQNYISLLNTYPFPKEILLPLTLPMPWKNLNFIPLYYGYLTFLYNIHKTPHPPNNFIKLMNFISQNSLMIPYPGTSVMGFSFAEWVFYYSQKTPLFNWSSLKNKIKSMPSSWDFAYTLFYHGEVDFVIGYTTSLLAQNAESKSIQMILFEEGNPLHVYGIFQTAKGAKDPDTIKIVQILLSSSVQKAIVEKLFMYPVIPQAVTKELSELPHPFKVLNFEKTSIKSILKYWYKIFR